jgi:hypothetical protein
MLLCDNVPQRLNLVKYFDNSPPLFSFLGIVAFKVGYGAVIKNFSQNDKKKFKNTQTDYLHGECQLGRKEHTLAFRKSFPGRKKKPSAFSFCSCLRTACVCNSQFKTW